MADSSRALGAVEVARAMAEAGREEEAIRWYRRALRERPGEPGAAAGLVAILLQQGDLPAAYALLRQASDRAPFDPRLAGLRRDTAFALYNAQLWEAAAPWLATAAELEPWDKSLEWAAERTRRPDHLAQSIADPTNGRIFERYAPRESETYIFVIEIVGTCNLRCPTCPVGNTARAERPIGFMKRDLFEALVVKIRRDSPVATPHVNLYNWGEPLLHPDLPHFIGTLKNAGMRAHLSSNLNIKRGLEQVLAAEPHEIKISLSGFTPHTYTKTHAGGNIELVKANMRKLSSLWRARGCRTKIWVGHHIYKSNRHEVEDVRRFCGELGFEYVPMEAFYMPIERLMEVLAGGDIDAAIIADLPTHPLKRARRMRARRGRRYDCELRFNQTVINHDGIVALCCTVYDQPNMLGVKYLDESFEAIEARKYNHAFCERCYDANLQYAPAEIDLIAAGVGE